MLALNRSRFRADLGADWDSYETVYAGYAMYTLTTGKMTLMGGARIEGTHIKYDWNQAYDDVAEDNELTAAIPRSGTSTTSMSCRASG